MSPLGLGRANKLANNGHDTRAHAAPRSFAVLLVVKHHRVSPSH